MQCDRIPCGQMLVREPFLITCQQPALPMDSFVGTPAWYILLLLLGLATGVLYQWFQKNRNE